jgi:hypothetical protein
VDFRPLSVKSTSKLVSWLGKFFTPTRTLVKSVLSAQPAYYLSTLNALSEVIEEINIRHKHFTWTKHTNLREESAKWHGLRSACPPNTAGWHKKYARALRLHWLWMEWKDPQKPWVDMPISCNVGDRRLFTGTTTITVGGKGGRQKQLAPAIYNLSQKKTSQPSWRNSFNYG